MRALSVCCRKVGVGSCSLELGLGVSLINDCCFFISGVFYGVSCICFHLRPFPFSNSLDASACVCCYVDPFPFPHVVSSHCCSPTCSLPLYWDFSFLFFSFLLFVLISNQSTSLSSVGWSSGDHSMMTH
jgi:hypothetical protein